MFVIMMTLQLQLSALSWTCPLRPPLPCYELAPIHINGLLENMGTPELFAIINSPCYYPGSLKFSRHAGLDPVSRSHIMLIIFWIPAFAGMTTHSL